MVARGVSSVWCAEARQLPTAAARVAMAQLSSKRGRSVTSLCGLGPESRGTSLPRVIHIRMLTFRGKTFSLGPISNIQNFQYVRPKGI